MDSKFHILLVKAEILQISQVKYSFRYPNMMVTNELINILKVLNILCFCSVLRNYFRVLVYKLEWNQYQYVINGFVALVYLTLVLYAENVHVRILLENDEMVQETENLSFVSISCFLSIFRYFILTISSFKRILRKK